LAAYSIIFFTWHTIQILPWVCYPIWKVPYWGFN
jgi:hypothetical protein